MAHHSFGGKNSHSTPFTTESTKELSYVNHRVNDLTELSFMSICAIDHAIAIFAPNDSLTSYSTFTSDNDATYGLCIILDGRLQVGSNSIAAGERSVAFGHNCYTQGIYSFAHGLNCNTTKHSFWSHSEGSNCCATGAASHSEGYSTTSDGNYAHSEGSYTLAKANCSHSEGLETTAYAYCSHSEGELTEAYGIASHTEGHGTETLSMYSHAEGIESRTFGESAHAEGNVTTASGNSSHSEGHLTTASGNCSHSEGYNTLSYGQYSHAEGESTSAYGIASNTKGYGTEAYGNYALAIGYECKANGGSSFAGGIRSDVKLGALYSLAYGYDVKALVQNSIALGKSSSGAHENSFIWSSEAAQTLTSETYNIQALNGLHLLSNTRAYLQDDSVTAPLVYNELVCKGYVDALTGGSSYQSLTGLSASVVVMSSSATYSTYDDFRRHDWGLVVPYNLRNLSTTSSSSSVALGVNTFCDGNQSFAMGLNSIANGHQSMSVGLNSLAAGEGSVALGYSSSAYSQGSTCIGYNSSASGQGSIALGYRASTSRQGQLAVANGGFGGVKGTAQSSIIVQYVSTSGNTPTNMDAEGKGYTMLLETETVYNIVIQVAAKSETATTDNAIWNFRSAIRRRNTAATTQIISNNRFADLVPAGWDCNISADTTNGALNIVVTGAAGHDIRWVATIYVTEVHT